MIHWDLSRSHRPADVGWDLTPQELADEQLQAKSIENVGSVRVRLPEGKSFTAADDVGDVTMSREGDRLTDLSFAFDDQTAEGAYERAMALVREWGLEGRNIEEWYTEAKGKTGSAAADVNTSGVFAEVFGPDHDAGRIGPDGPVVSVSIVYSFDDERPFTVQFELYWGSRPAR